MERAERPKRGCFNCGCDHYKLNCLQNQGNGKGKGLRTVEEWNWYNWSLGWNGGDRQGNTDYTIDENRQLRRKEAIEPIDDEDDGDDEGTPQLVSSESEDEEETPYETDDSDSDDEEEQRSPDEQWLCGEGYCSPRDYNRCEPWRIQGPAGHAPETGP